MALITGRVIFPAGGTIYSADQNNNDGTIWNEFNGNISNANISSSAAIADTKLAQITTSAKVSGSALTSLSSTPSGAGSLPGINGGIPSGGIIMWSGTIANIPSGFYLCDGNNSTPNLTNRFIVGADADSGGVAKSTITGSALQTHDTGVMPAHTHTYIKSPGASSTGSDAGGDGTQTLDTENTGSTGTGTKVIAVFYALAFIMKS